MVLCELLWLLIVLFDFSFFCFCYCDVYVVCFGVTCFCLVALAFVALWCLLI